MDVESLSMYLAIKSVHFIVSFFYINEYCKYTINIHLISLQGPGKYIVTLDFNFSPVYETILSYAIESTRAKGSDIWTNET